jgi:transcriptional regulator with XRE-family HTH domain
MTKDIAILKTFGTNLKKYRKHKGLSQRQLFRLCGVDNGTISRMENGQVNPTLNTLFILADALEIPSCSLLMEADHENI